MESHLTVTTDASFMAHSAGLAVVIHAFHSGPWGDSDAWRHLTHIVIAKMHTSCGACTDGEELAFLYAVRTVRQAFGNNRDVRICSIAFTTDSQFVRDASLHYDTSVDRALRHLALFFGISDANITLHWQPRSDAAMQFADAMARSARTNLQLDDENQSWYHIRNDTGFDSLFSLD